MSNSGESTSVFFLSLPYEEQHTVQSNLFGRFLVKRTDSLFDNSFKRNSLFLIAKSFLSALGHGHSLKKL